jgi:hypothetical protein
VHHTGRRAGTAADMPVIASRFWPRCESDQLRADHGMALTIVVDSIVHERVLGWTPTYVSNYI